MSAPESPSALLHRAASLMRERAQAVTGEAWRTRPWEVTQCSDPESGECPCIVYQGEYKPYTEAQVPLIQYVCDAEGAEFAAYIAGMHPLVGLELADLLDAEGERAAQIDAYQGTPVYLAMLDGYRLPLAVARAFLAEPEPEGAKP